MTSKMVAGFSYLLALAVSVVGSLWTWTLFHASLRALGEDRLIFFSTACLIGTFTFAVTGTLLRRLPGDARTFGHLPRTWMLYTCAVAAMLLSFAYWPAEGAEVEGGNITGLLVAILSILGIKLDFMLSRCGCAS